MSISAGPLTDIFPFATSSNKSIARFIHSLRLTTERVASNVYTRALPTTTTYPTRKNKGAKRMRGNATFETTNMDNRASILEDLGTRNLDDLRKILDTIRLCENADHLKPLDDNTNNDDYGKNAQHQDVVNLRKHSDDVVHADTGVFA